LLDFEILMRLIFGVKRSPDVRADLAPAAQ
jgi:hypothetical protein